MTSLSEIILILLLMLNLYLLGSSRLRVLIRIMALEGLLLALLPLLFVRDEINTHTLLIAGAGFIIKSVIIPLLLTRALRAARANREVEPFVGYPLSIAAGIVFTILAFWVNHLLPSWRTVSHYYVAVAVSMLLCGLFIIITRRKAISQVIGYLILENGIYVFGMSIVPEQPLFVEMGVLLDVFVGVFIMGITLYNINREFDHIDVDRLDRLKDES